LALVRGSCIPAAAAPLLTRAAFFPVERVPFLGISTIMFFNVLGGCL